MEIARKFKKFRRRILIGVLILTLVSIGINNPGMMLIFMLLVLVPIGVITIVIGLIKSELKDPKKAIGGKEQVDLEVKRLLKDGYSTDVISSSLKMRESEVIKIKDSIQSGRPQK